MGGTRAATRVLLFQWCEEKHGNGDAESDPSRPTNSNRDTGSAIGCLALFDAAVLTKKQK